MKSSISKTILINSLILSVGILIGRLSGYIREIIIASKFGATVDADNILLMLSVPNLLNNLLTSGAITGILIPLLNENREKIEEILLEFNKKLLVISLFFYLAIVIIIFNVYNFYIFSILSISILSIFPNVYTFIISGYLQFEKRFKRQSLNTLIFNSVIIVTLLLGMTSFYFAFGVVLAALARMIFICGDLKFTKISFKNFLGNSNSNNVKYGPLIFMIIANGLLYINPMIDKMVAKIFDVGAVSILSYSEKIYLLPVSVFLTTYAVAMFPDLSKMVVEGKKREINHLLKKSIFLNLSISIIIAFMIYYFSIEIVSLFFGIANLNSEIIFKISKSLNGYLVDLIMAGTNSILLNLFFSHKLYNKLIYYSIFMVISNLFLDYIVLKNGFGIEYVAYVTSFLALLSPIYLFLLYYYGVKKGNK